MTASVPSFARKCIGASSKLVLLLLLCLCALGADSTAAPRGAALEVQLFGCADVSANDGACLVEPDQTLDVWMSQSFGVHPVIELDGQPPTAESRTRVGGALGGDGERATINISGLEAPAILRIRPQGSAEVIERKIAPLGAPSEVQKQADALRVELRRVLREVDIQRALELFEDLRKRAPTLLHAGSECLDRGRLLHYFAQHDDPDARGPQLAAEILAKPFECRAVGVEPTYYAAEYAYWKGDLLGAKKLVDDAYRWTARRGVDSDYHNARSLLVLVEHGFGRSKGGCDQLRALVASTADQDDFATERSIMLQNAAWALMDLEDPTIWQPQCSPLDWLRESLRLAPGAKPDERLSVLADLTLAFIRAEKLDEAELALAEALNLAGALEEKARKEGFDSAESRPAAAANKVRPDKVFDRAELTWVTAELLLAQGKLHGARLFFMRLAEQAPELPTMRWEACHGAARVLAVEGKVDEASRTYDRCDAEINDLGLRIPLGAGRESFLGRFQRASREHVALLLQFDPVRALQVARASRTRVLARLRWLNEVDNFVSEKRSAYGEALTQYRNELQIAAREARRLDHEPPTSWFVNKETEALARLTERLAELGIRAAEPELPPLEEEEGELDLIFQRLPRGWVGFAVNNWGMRWVNLGPLSPNASAEEQSELLLRPFETELLSAASVRIFAQGELERIDFHALPWQAAALVDQLSVAYGVDVTPPPRSPTASPMRAVLVDSATEGLFWTHREIQRAAARLTEIGLQVVVLYDAQATVQGLRAALENPTTAVFHYAGHAVGGGTDGSRGALKLAGQERLSIGEILTLHRVPDIVVLSACEAAATSDEGQTGAIGLAQAFVVSGARAVLAPTKCVNDRLAGHVMGRLYDDPLHGPPETWDLPEALRSATAGETNPDWVLFRALVP